jgi:antitoxin component YwqK of YwqJK toxin-antitoxin module
VSRRKSRSQVARQQATAWPAAGKGGPIRRRIAALLWVLGLSLAVVVGLWWWGYFYRPVRLDEAHDDGSLKTLVLVHRRRAFQIPAEFWGGSRPATWAWYWLPEVTHFHPGGQRSEHGWCAPFPVKSGAIELDRPAGAFKPEGLWLGWYADGRPEFEYRYRGGFKEGPSKRWHANGQLQEEGSYRRDRKHGAWTAWHKNGQLEWRGSFLAGQLHGVWTTFHANGQLRARPTYDQGRLTGEEVIYDDQGRMTTRKHWVSGRENGLREVVLPHGRRVVQFVKDDKLAGEHREFDAQGRLLVEGQYESDKMQGRWRNYFPGGRVQWERRYQDDRLEGPERRWRDDGSLESEGAYLAGERHGPWTDWDATGQKAAEGEYRQSLRHGEWIFYQDGTPLRKTTYRGGQVMDSARLE